MVNRLYTLDYIKKRDILKEQADQQKELHEMQECSFRPKTNNASKPVVMEAPVQGGALPKGFSDTVGRMRQAQLIQKRKKEQLEHIPAGENYHRIREANIQPPSFLQKKKSVKKAPFIHIDINVAPGK